MWLFWLVVIGLAVALLYRLLAAGRDGAGGRESAVEILKQRYARGDIPKEEYERKLADLTH